MRSLLIVLFLSAVSPAFGQQLCSIQVLYERCMHAERFSTGEKDILIKRVTPIAKRACAAKAFNANIEYFQYLVNHFTPEIDEAALLRIPDSLRLQRAYRKALRQSTTLNTLLDEYAAKVLFKNQPKDSIKNNVLLDFAVKYFSLRKITPEGYYAAKICAGLNDIVATEPKRMPHIEAFCFSMVFLHAQGTEYPLMAEMTKAVRELYTLNLGIDPAERLLRAQGALYILMRNNPVLQAMLKAEYAARAEYLPFVVIP